MTPSPAYRVCVEALEKVLSPRVASRSLHVALDAAGVSPQQATPDDLEPILKDAVFKQLQVAMPPERARDLVVEILEKIRASAEVPPAEAEGEAPSDRPPPDSTGVTATHETATPKNAATGTEQAHRQPSESEAPSTAQSEEPEEFTRLRSATRPFNLYFEWPEVRRLRALLARIEDVVQHGDEADLPELYEEARGSLEAVEQKLEDRLVLQAQELARLQESLEEVATLGGPKVRRLENMVKRIREAQDDRQLADAEVERGGALARDLRKLVASSVYREAESEGGPDLEARIKALDVDAELAEIDRLARDRAVLLEHREDLAQMLADARNQVQSGLTLGGELATLRERLEEERASQLGEVRRELQELSQRLDAKQDAWTPELRREHDVLRDIVADAGLPPLADLVRFRDRVELTLERSERAGRQAEAELADRRVRLDAQGERLERARHELLRYGDDLDEPAVERLREAVEALRLAQAEERLDAELDEAVRLASEAIAEGRRDHSDPEAAVHAQLITLLDRLDGLPASTDPEGTIELRKVIEARLDDPPDDPTLVTLAATVADAVAEATSVARRTLDRLSAEAGRWSLPQVLDAVRDANERLEDGRAPELGELERRLATEIEDTLADQLDRLHALERDAERLTDIDEEVEEALADALGRAREQVAAGDPAGDLAQAEQRVAQLQVTLERRIGDVLPRLDAALSTFSTVERLNSDDVGTVRRILHHLDGQRDAFARVSPALRARMERSLQEAEDLLGSLVEEERTTRAIADQLMSGGNFDELLGLFGESGAGAEGEAGPQLPASDDDDAGGDAVDSWLAHNERRSDVSASGLLSRDGRHGRSQGMPDGRLDDWVPASQAVVDRMNDLGRALDLGEPRVVALEHEGGCLLLGHDRSGSALLAGREPASLGLLVRELREDAWRRAAALLAQQGEAAHDGSAGAADAE